MGRITDAFARRAEAKQTMLIPYLVAGDPNLETSLEVMHTMVEAGADLIEIGVPFTDPEAEGPVIQLAHERALKNNVSLRDSLEMVAKFREKNDHTPIIFMGYLNPLDAMGYSQFASEAARCGVDGALIVNMPPEEGQSLNRELSLKGVDSIYLLAPTTTDERAKYVCAQGSGFVYYVSLKGTTGASNINYDDVEVRYKHLKPYCELPLVVGFGIKDGPSAARVAQFSEGSVVGTAVVSLFEKHQSAPHKIAAEVTALLTEMRTEMDRVNAQ